MVRLVLGAESLENEDGVIDGGGLDLYRLKATLQSGVLLDVLTVFIQCRGSDALELTATEGGLDDVGGVHGTLRRTCSDDGMKLVDEEDDVLVLADLIHDGLDALLELTTVLRAGDHERQIERDDLLVVK